MCTKVCTKCNLEKPIDCYHKDARNKTGTGSHCKECVSLRKKEYRQRPEVKERNRQWHKEYREGHIDEIREYHREYRKKWFSREDVKERYIQRMAEYRRTDAYKESRKKHYKTKAEKYREKNREYRLKNADKIKERHRKYMDAHKEELAEKRKAKRLQNIDVIRQREREEYAKNKDDINQRKRQARARNIERYRETNRVWYNKNRDRIRAVSNAYRRSRADFFAAIVKEWHKKNPDVRKRLDAERIEKITDGYVKNLIASTFRLSAEERKYISEEIINVKRINIQLKREIKKQYDKD